MMPTVRYKDYVGSVVYERGRLTITLLHIDDAISTQCDAASEAQGAFEELVDDYLETCKQLGKEPAKPFRGSFNVRIDPDQHRRAAIAATSTLVSLNAWVGEAIAEKLAQHSGSAGTDPGFRPDNPARLARSAIAR